MPTLAYKDQPVLFALPKIVQGEDWSWSFALQNPDTTPVNTAGMSFACMMRESADARSVAFSPAVAVSSNTVTLTLSRTLTAAVTQSKRLVYDIFQTDSLGKKTPLFQGAVLFEAAITR